MSTLHEPISLRRLAIEFATLVVGVLLALAAEEWRIGREHQAVAATAVDGVRLEVAANRVIVQKRSPYHRAMLDSVRLMEQRLILKYPGGMRLRPGAHLSSFNEMGFMNGLALSPPPTTTAWQTLLNTNTLPFVNYRITSALSRTYAKQEELRDQTTTMANELPLFVSGIVGDKPVIAMIVLDANLNDLVLREGELLKAYDSLLGVIGEPRPRHP
ncbi:MAG: hypothetical protein NVS4B3_10520 [Gemmatimonadaceae bacterium]